jgi:hypothetical protein
MTRHWLSVSALIAITACSSNALGPPAPVVGSNDQGARWAAPALKLAPGSTCPAGVNLPTWPDNNELSNKTSDGDFNGAPFPQRFTEYRTPNLIPGTNWTVSVGNVDLVGFVEWNNHPGPGTDCTVDLDGSVHGGISETFTTTPGVVYHVHFQLSGSTALPPPNNINRMQVSAAGQSRIFTWNVLPAGHDVFNGVYELKFWKFTAAPNTATSTLEFKSLDPPANPNSGAVVTEIYVE